MDSICTACEQPLPRPSRFNLIPATAVLLILLFIAATASFGWGPFAQKPALSVSNPQNPSPPTIASEQISDGSDVAIYPVRPESKIVVCENVNTLDEFGRLVIHPDRNQSDRLYAEGKAIILEPGTRVKVTENRFYLLFVEVLDGQYSGRKGVLSENMAKFAAK
ncbi:MAG: hypothetical protein U0798_13935 [Gemmataceae bacterium]